MEGDFRYVLAEQQSTSACYPDGLVLAYMDSDGKDCAHMYVHANMRVRKDAFARIQCTGLWAPDDPNNLLQRLRPSACV